MKSYGHRYKVARVGTFYVAVIRGESCFEKNAFEDTENSHPPTKTRLPVKEYLGKYSRYRKNFCFVLKLFLRPILFHGKLSFDNLNYFKLYGNLKLRRTLIILWSFSINFFNLESLKMPFVPNVRKSPKEVKKSRNFFLAPCYKISISL